MIEEPAVLGQLYVTSLTALSSTIQNTLTNNLTSLTLTDASVISVNSLQDALRITQTGSGNALLVEDSANLDGTPFVITSSGDVGVGVLFPTTKLDVNGTIKGDALQVNNIQSTNIQGTNATFTNTGTFPTLVSTNVTTQNVVFPQNGTGNIVNDAAFYGNLTIYGAISALSGLSVTSTFTSQSSALSVVNTGPEIALFVSQGPNLSGVATFIGSGTEVLKINNPNPNPNNLPAVVVNGVLSASGGTSTNWNSVYTNVQSNSANWNSAYATTTALSSNLWNDVYTNVRSNSANWNAFSIYDGLTADEITNYRASNIWYLSSLPIDLPQAGTYELDLFFQHASLSSAQTVFGIIGGLSSTNTFNSFMFNNVSKVVYNNFTNLIFFNDFIDSEPVGRDSLTINRGGNFSVVATVTTPTTLYYFISSPNNFTKPSVGKCFYMLNYKPNATIKPF